MKDTYICYVYYGKSLNYDTERKEVHAETPEEATKQVAAATKQYLQEIGSTAHTFEVYVYKMELADVYKYTLNHGT